MQKILIVDDEIIMQKIASKILSSKYKTVCASSGEEAIELFETEKPDMVLSDLLMPEMDGYELHSILQEKALEPVPIVFMTADESDESESHGFEIGAADYIRKPLKADILLRRVSNILDNLDKMQGLKQAADIDSMTGLLNKTAAQREIEKICATAKGVLLMLDLDSFKLVNDIYGHAMGDKILITFAELLKNITRESDLIGRLGGDEFIAFCHDIKSENVVAEKAKYLNENLTAAAKKLMGEDMNISLGVSVGAIFVPTYGTDFKTLYQKMDKALYKVKQNGKHGYSVYSEENHSDEQQNFSDVSQIFGERNAPKGAYFLELETFKLIYRFLFRLVTAYQKDCQLLTLTINTENESAIEELGELLKNNLSVSDCIAQGGKDKFFILLPETKSSDVQYVTMRLSAKIKTTQNLSPYKITFDSKSL